MTHSKLNADRSARSWQIEQQPLRDLVIARIRDGVLDGELAMGTQLIEQELAERIGVSRAPVREALQRLEEEGLVDHHPRVGRFVHVITRDEVRDVQEIRGMLEGWAARRLADRSSHQSIDEVLDRLEAMVKRMEDQLAHGDLDSFYEASQEFHITIVQNAGSDILDKLHRSVMTLAIFIRQLLGRIASRQNEAIEEHRRVLQAIRTGDASQANALMIEHYRTGSAAIQEALESLGQEALGT